MAFVSREKGSLYYEVHGSGEPLVLIRGLGRWSEHWCGWHLELAKYFKVILFDGRGLGRSTAPIALKHTMSDLANDVKSILDIEKIPRATLFGVSLGGMIALQFAIDFPDKAVALHIVNSSIGRSGHLRMTPKAASVILSAPVKQDQFYRNLAKVLVSKDASDVVVDKFANSWEKIDRNYSKPYATVAVQLAIAARWRRWEDFSRISCPVNIIVSEEDQFVPKGNSLFIHDKIKHSTLTRVPRAGHEIHMEIKWMPKEDSMFSRGNFV